MPSPWEGADPLRDARWTVTGGVPRVALLLGKPPERSPVLPEVIQELQSRGADVRVHVPRPDDWLPTWLAEADIAALRGLPAGPLAAVAALEEHGLRCCNTARATLAVRDRSGVQRALAGARIPVPAAADVADADAARRWAAGRAVVVKSPDATAGRGAGVALWTEPERDPPPPFPGPYVVQEWVTGDGIDRKLYVVGERVGGLLKRRDVGRRSGDHFRPDASLDALARDVGTCLGLRIYGVDLIEGAHGRVVVDINAFPSCAGVPSAAASIASTLLDSASR